MNRRKRILGAFIFISLASGAAGLYAQIRDVDRRIAAVVQEILPDLIAVRRDIR